MFQEIFRQTSAESLTTAGFEDKPVMSEVAIGLVPLLALLQKTAREAGKPGAANLFNYASQHITSRADSDNAWRVKDVFDYFINYGDWGRGQNEAFRALKACVITGEGLVQPRCGHCDTPFPTGSYIFDPKIGTFAYLNSIKCDSCGANPPELRSPFQKD